MEKKLDMEEIINLTSKKKKANIAINLQKGSRTKETNYFNYQFDIYSLANYIKRMKSKIKNNRVAIISENRYEWFVTYLASIISGCDVIVFSNNCSKTSIIKTIKRYEINTVFFSQSYEGFIIEIFKENVKINSNKKSRKKSTTNLINFDSSIYPNIIKFEKMINIGRYIENYNISENKKDKVSTTICINKYGEEKIKEPELILQAQKIKKKLKILWKKNIYVQITDYMQDLNSVLMQVIFSFYAGICLTDVIARKNAISIESKDGNTIILYKSKKYKLNYLSQNETISKMEENSKTKFRVLKNKNKMEAKKNTVTSKELILIKATK